MRQLVELRWLEHDERGYRLGARFRLYSSQVTDCGDLRAAASTALTDLNLATRGVAHLGVLDGPMVNYLDRVGGAASASIPTRVGTRVRATDTVCGHVLLASLAPEKADAVLSEAVRPAGRSPVCSMEPSRRVQYRKGLAFLPADRCRLGVTSLAAPITGPTGGVAAISVSVRGDVGFERLAPVLVRAARQTTQTLSAQHRAQESQIGHSVM